MPMVRGSAMLPSSKGINLGIGGALEFGESQGWEIAPVL